MHPSSPLGDGALVRSNHLRQQQSALEIDAASPAASAQGKQPMQPLAEDKDVQSMQGFRQPFWKLCCFVALAVATGGLSLLLAHWFPRLRILLSLSACPLRDAQFVVVQLIDGRTDITRVMRLVTAPANNSSSSSSAQPTPLHTKDVEDGRENLLDWQTSTKHILLEHRCSRYLYDPARGAFVPVPEIPEGFNQCLQKASQQLAVPPGGGGVPALDPPDWDLAERSVRYGTNEMRIPVKGVAALIFAEMWHPFYCFQYASIAIWVFGDQYYTYAVCIAVITWFSIISSALESHSNMRRLAKVAHFETDVAVFRDGLFQTVSSTQLVPGDIIVVQPASTMPCDATLLCGRECIVDESMLTGESVPVRKVAYSAVSDGLGYTPDKNSGCTLFAGTGVTQARAARGGKVLAMVCRTRFFSAKGQLLRSILFPRHHQQSFVSDSLKFIAVMLIGCMALYVWAAVVLASVGAGADRIVVRFFDMITIAVPPALPACLTIAVVFSTRRLRKNDIYVTAPDHITMAGQLDVICFDKTGTLTEPGLELQGIVPVSDGGFQPICSDVPQLPQLLQQLLASCHGLAVMDGALVGDPLDQRLFEATRWDLLDAEEGDGMDDGEEGRPGLGAGVAGGSGAEAAAGGVGGALSLPGHQRPLGVHTLGGTGTNAAQPGKVVGGSVGMVPLAPLAPVAAPPMGNGAAAAADEAWQRQQHHVQVHMRVRPPGAPPEHCWSIVKRFEFRSELQRSMVLVQGPESGSSGVCAFVKGSPEAIRALVDPSSVPPDFEDVLGAYTREGLRVLALAAGSEGGGSEGAPTTSRGASGGGGGGGAWGGPGDSGAGGAPGGALTLLQCSQEEVEQRVRLALVGLAVMVNPLRPDSGEVIQKLHAASIRTAMVTGDHLHTAISVAHLCGIMPLGKPVLLVDGAAGVMPGSASTQQLPSVAVQPPRLPAAAAPAAEAAVGFAESEAPLYEGPPGAEYTFALPGRVSELDPAALEMHLSVLHPGGNVDQVLTAVEVSSAAAAVMAGELACAVTGKGFNRLLETRNPVLLLACLRHASVYARMSPDNKRDLMGLLGDGLEWVDACPHLGLHVGFCGDGANDCGALKASHVGVSLCEAEASVAAPMTSKQQTTAAMLTVVGEGRCSLVATFQIFQFIIGYALVQAFETNLMYTYALNVGNYQYLIEDLFFTTVLAALMGYTWPRKQLAAEKPPVRVMTLPIMTSTVLQLVVVVVFQLLAIYALSRQTWYEASLGPPDLRLARAPENTVTYIIALAQFVILAIVFNQGRPHRRALVTNVGLLLALVAQSGFVIYTLYSVDWFNTEVQELVDKSQLDNRFRTLLLVLICTNAVAAFAMASLSAGCVALVRWVWPAKVEQGLRYTESKKDGADQPLVNGTP